MTARTRPRRRSTWLGDDAVATLLPVQFFHSAGEAMFAVSLVGSLFFNVTVDAAQPRILLYLAVTMAPFAVLAPLIGPFVDRLPGGHRWVLVVAIGSRALVALLLASQLKTLLLYPYAFLIVVAAKVYTVSRNSLVPSMVDDRSHLVLVNSRLARAGTVAGIVGAMVGLAILDSSSAAWVLRAGAGSYALGALAALRVPTTTHAATHVAPAVVETTEMHGPGVLSALAAMSTLRMATGFAFFHIGFSLKTGGHPAWVIGSVAAASSTAAFLGTFVAPRLRRRVTEQQMLTMSLALVAVAGVVTALRFHPVTAAVVAASLGMAGSVGRRGFDGVVQVEAPHARRGQAYAGLETRLEVAWVLGSIAAVLTRAPDWVGVLVLSGVVAIVVTERVRTDRAERRSTRESDSVSLPHRLLASADALALRGDHQQAALVGVAAVEAAAATGLVPAERAADLRSRVRVVVDEGPTADAATGSARELLGVAHRLVNDGRGRPPEPETRPIH